jgi:diguanylate cyclase (GGDEF)-like protein
VLPEIDGYNAHQFAEKVRRIVETSDFRFEGTKMDVTISMGVATLDADTADAAALIERADERLYEAKKAGRNCVRG